MDLNSNEPGRLQAIASSSANYSYCCYCYFEDFVPYHLCCHTHDKLYKQYCDFVSN